MRVQLGANFDEFKRILYALAKESRPAELGSLWQQLLNVVRAACGAAAAAVAAPAAAAPAQPLVEPPAGAADGSAVPGVAGAPLDAAAPAASAGDDFLEEFEVVEVGVVAPLVDLPAPPAAIAAAVVACRGNTRAPRSPAVSLWLYLERLYQQRER